MAERRQHQIKKLLIEKCILIMKRIKCITNGEKNFKQMNIKKSANASINITGNCEDGLSLFYYARQHASEKKQIKIPTFVDTNEVTTNINFGIEHSDEDIDAVNYPIDVMKLDGRADFVGVFGLTGGFEGVFSNDVAGIPITARMKVILGSVKVELKELETR